MTRDDTEGLDPVPSDSYADALRTVFDGVLLSGGVTLQHAAAREGSPGLPPGVSVEQCQPGPHIWEAGPAIEVSERGWLPAVTRVTTAVLLVCRCGAVRVRRFDLSAPGSQ